MVEKRVGVLMLETRFPRWPGDIGHPGSLPWPTRYRRVTGARVGRVVRRDGPDPALRARLLEAGEALVAEGVDLVATSCGFLHGERERLERALGVPVVASALALLPELHVRHGAAGPIGILTFDARALGAAQLGAAAALDPVVVGLEGSRHFYPVIAEDRPEADRAAMTRDAATAAGRLARLEPAAVVLECTNLSPHRAAISAVLGDVPVHDIADAIAARLRARRSGSDGADQSASSASATCRSARGTGDDVRSVRARAPSVEPAAVSAAASAASRP